jgi:ketosteroid isomerase-like protein
MAQVINQLVDAMNAHDLDAVVQLFHGDYHSEQPAHPAREFGTSAQVRANWAAMFEGIPDFRAELVRLADDGHTCWTEWHWWGNRVDGQSFDMRGVVLFEIRDSLISGGRLYMEPVEHESNIEQAVEMQSGLPPAD